MSGLVEWAEQVASDPARRKKWAQVVIGLGLAVLGVFHARIYNTIAGPFAIEASELAHLDGVPFKQFVTLQRGGKPIGFTDLEATGTDEVRYNSGGSESVATYRLLRVDDRRLLVRVEQLGSGAAIEGVIREADTDFRMEGTSRISGFDPRMQVFLDCAETRYRNWSLALLGLAVLLIGLGADQLRRATQKPRPPASTRRLR